MLKKLLFIILLLLSTLGSMGRTPFWKPWIEKFYAHPEIVYGIYIKNNHNQTEILLNNKEELVQLINFCSKKKYPVTQIYLELPNYQPLQNELESFLEQIKKHNINAYYSVDINTSSSNIVDLGNTVEKFINFNSQLNYPFYGLHLNYANFIRQATSNIDIQQKNELLLTSAISKKIEKESLNLQLSASLPENYGEEPAYSKLLPQFYNYINSAVIEPENNNDNKEYLVNIKKIIEYVEEIKAECNLIIYNYNLLDDLIELQKNNKQLKTIIINYENIKNDH